MMIYNLTLVLENTGKSIPVIELSSEITIDELIQSLVKKNNLPFGTSGKLTRKITKKQLLPSQSLHEAGIEDGETLIVSLFRHPLRVFLCHSSTDKPTVRSLYTRLSSEKNIDAWLDEKKLLPGQDWDLEIKKALRDSDVIIVCLSRNSISREGYIQKEIMNALDIADEKPEDTIFIIPLKLEDCQTPRRLSRWQWVNYYDENGYEMLMRSLRHRASKLAVFTS